MHIFIYNSNNLDWQGIVQTPIQLETVNAVDHPFPELLKHNFELYFLSTQR